MELRAWPSTPSLQRSPAFVDLGSAQSHTSIMRRNLPPTPGSGLGWRAFRRRRLLRFFEHPEPAEHGFGGALARFPGPGHRAPKRLMHGFARKPDLIAERLRQGPARRLVARARGGPGAEHPWLLVPTRRAGALDGLSDIGAKKLRQPIAGEGHHRRLTLGREVAAKIAADLDHGQRRAGHVG